jgi:hypothetical protein
MCHANSRASTHTHTHTHTHKHTHTPLSCTHLHRPVCLSPSFPPPLSLPLFLSPSSPSPSPAPSPSSHCIHIFQGRLARAFSGICAAVGGTCRRRGGRDGGTALVAAGNGGVSVVCPSRVPLCVLSSVSLYKHTHTPHTHIVCFPCTLARLERKVSAREDASRLRVPLSSSC